MKHSLILLYCLSVFLFSCDPARRIEMKNRSNDTAEIIWKVKKDSIGFNPFNLSNARELKFRIPPYRKAGIKMSFGTGTWSPEEVENLIKRLESFEIISPNQHIKIDSLPQLKSFLLTRRKGSSRIEIVIDK